MCISPISIRNPNYGVKTDLIVKTCDTKSAFIRVPCGVCSECVQKRQSDLVQRCRCLSLDHYIFFCTLTYNRESLPTFTCSSGVSISYAAISDVQNMFKRIRVSKSIERPFKYFFVSERGSKGRPHFHGLIFILKNSSDDKLFPSILETYLRNLFFSEWKRNYGSKRSPVWKPLFTFRSKYVGSKRYSNFDFHYVVPHSSEHGSDDVAFYVSKYVLKPSMFERRLQQALRLNLSPDEFSEVWRLVKSRSFWSKDFGSATDLERDFVRSCIKRSSSDVNGFQFINLDGSRSRLCRFYRKFVDVDSALSSASARGVFSSFERDMSELDSSNSNYSSVIDSISKRDISEFLP